jgi:hypothetical protein
MEAIAKSTATNELSSSGALLQTADDSLVCEQEDKATQTKPQHAIKIPRIGFIAKSYFVYWTPMFDIGLHNDHLWRSIDHVIHLQQFDHFPKRRLVRHEQQSIDGAQLRQLFDLVQAF